MAEGVSDRLETWGVVIVSLAAVAGIGAVIVGIAVATSEPHPLYAWVIVAYGVGWVVTGVWLKALHDAASVAVLLAGRQTEALEVLAERCLVDAATSGMSSGDTMGN